MRALRILLIILVVLVLLPVIGLGVFLARFDPNHYKPEIVAAVERATGRRFGLSGPLRVAYSLTPTISASGVTLAGAAGGPPLLRLKRVQAQVSLLALLRGTLELTRLDLVDPRIALAIDRLGRGNWMLAPARAPGTGGGATREMPEGRRALGFAIRSVHLRGAEVSFVDARTGRSARLAVAALALDEAGPAAPMHLSARATFQGLSATISMTTGTLAGLSGGAHAWPVQARLTLAGATFRVAGTLDQPLGRAGYRLVVTASVPALEALAPLWPGLRLPPVHDLAAAAHVAGAGAGMPAVSDVTATAGRTDLAAVLPGLVLDQARIAAIGPDRPVSVALEASRNGASFALAGTVGPLFGRPPGRPAPVDLTLHAGPAAISARGTLADPRSLGGARIALKGDIPALAALRRLAGQALPKLAALGFSGELVTGPAGPGERVGIEGLTLHAPGIALAGSLSAHLAGRVAVTGSLRAANLDLDTLARLLPRPAGPPPAAGAGTGAGAAPPPLGLLPSTPLPFAMLSALDGDLSLSARRLVWRGVAYRDLAAHLHLAGGTLTLSPFALRLPGGLVQGTGSANSAGTVAVALRAPGLALGPMLAAYHLPPEASGTLEAFATLTGKGASLQAIAAGLDGGMGAAMVDGTIDGRLIGQVLGNALHAAGLLAGLIGRQGPESVRCLALRLDARGGQGVFRALLLRSSRSYIDGGGATAFGPETLALDLNPRVREGRQTMVVPVHVGGTWAAPKLRVRPSAAVASGAQLLGQIGKGGIFGQFAKALGPAAAPLPEQACAPALALARGGAAGPAPSGTPASPPAAGAPRPLLP